MQDDFDVDSPLHAHRSNQDRSVDKAAAAMRMGKQPSQQSARQSTRGVSREEALRKVYREFDLDRNGDVGEDEMLLLGQTRRVLGQKAGEWTKQVNARLMVKIGAERNGSLSEPKFVQYFDETLPDYRTEFDRIIKQFMKCAQACRKTKLHTRGMRLDPAAKRSASSGASSTLVNESCSTPATTTSRCREILLQWVIGLILIAQVT